LPTALITGADRGLGLSLTRRLANMQWRVFAGSYLADWPELGELAASMPDRITLVDLNIGSDQSVESAAESLRNQAEILDLIVNNAAVSSPYNDRTIHDQLDYADIMRVFDINSLGALRVTNAFLPLMNESQIKRLCFVSSEAGSISRCTRESWYGYCMSKAALNMGVMQLFHHLRPYGYTFRLFHPGWMKTYMSGKKNDRAELEPDDVAAAALAHFINGRGRIAGGEDDEDRLVVRDWSGREWPW